MSRPTYPWRVSLRSDRFLKQPDIGSLRIRPESYTRLIDDEKPANNKVACELARAPKHRPVNPVISPKCANVSPRERHDWAMQLTLTHCRDRTRRFRSLRRQARGCPSILLLITLHVVTSLTLNLNAAGLRPEEHATIYRELQEPIQVKLKNKRTIPGHSINVSGDTLQIGTSEGAGEIIFTFKTDEVDSFSIPGESYKTLVVEWIESGETEKALELIELLYMQRVQLIPLLPPSESNFFTYYIDLILDSDNPARAIAVTEVLRPQIESPAALRALDDAILESYHNLELYDEALPLAQAWVASRTPYSKSALGYYVLGTAALRTESYNEALDLALQPIVFSSPITNEKIAHCYAVAVSAALGLREKDYAIILYKEMLERELSWPENDTTLAPFHKTILKEITDV